MRQKHVATRVSVWIWTIRSDSREDGGGRSAQKDITNASVAVLTALLFYIFFHTLTRGSTYFCRIRSLHKIHINFTKNNFRLIVKNRIGNEK